MVVAMFDQKHVDRSFRASELGVVALIAVLATPALNLPIVIGALAYIGVLGSILFLFRHRKQDEFLEKHWNAGATTAFFALCLWGLIAPFTVGVYDGVTGSEQGRSVSEFLAKGILPIALISFFGAFQLSRFRNS